MCTYTQKIMLYITAENLLRQKRVIMVFYLIILFLFNSLKYYYWYEKKYGDFLCRYYYYHVSLRIIILSYEIISANLFPLASSDSGFTFFYQILISLSFFKGFLLSFSIILIEIECNRKQSTFMISLVALSIAQFLLEEIKVKYQRYNLRSLKLRVQWECSL